MPINPNLCCVNNLYVDCADHTKCAKCGWNTDTARRRIAKMFKEGELDDDRRKLQISLSVPVSEP